jgi:hypothetical protein
VSTVLLVGRRPDQSVSTVPATKCLVEEAREQGWDREVQRHACIVAMDRRLVDRLGDAGL